MSISDADSSDLVVDDITPAFGVVNFTDGERTRWLQLTVVDDDIPEALERFTITLFTDAASVSGGVKGVHVEQNDAPVRFSQVSCRRLQVLAIHDLTVKCFEASDIGI